MLVRIEAVACGDADAWAGDCREVTLAEQEGPDFPCLDDVDCEDGGYCLGRVAPWGTCLCQAPSCQSDADCDGGVCWCEGARSRCIAAECREDADCEGEARCAVVSVSSECGDSSPSLVCTDADDECHTAEDCDMFQQCDYVDREGRRQCVPTQGPCG